MTIKKYLKNPRLFGLALARRLTFIPDKTYLRLIYLFNMGKPLNLNNPKTFQEKLQWLKINNRLPVMTTMVDKDTVKQFVAKRIGDRYIIPSLGAWNSVDEIDFNQLPEKFVLKTTHGGGGGGIVICKNKSTFDRSEAKAILDRSLKHDIYKNFREWPYRDASRRIIAEQLLEMPDNSEISDYKIFCFNGKPRFLKVDFGRFVEHHANYYDLDWRILPFGEEGLMPVPTHKIPKPTNLNEMLDIAIKLSSGQPFLRIDLYNIAGQIYFGELTFYPGSGLIHFRPIEWDIKIGDMLNILTNCTSTANPIASGGGGIPLIFNKLHHSNIYICRISA